MKTLHQKRLVSLLLVLCMLVGLVGLFPAMSFAASTSASGTYVKDGSANSSEISNVLLYRNFEDGKTVVNGCSNQTGANVEIVTSGDNSYYRFNGNSSEHTYLSYTVGSDVPKSGALVFQFDIMFESLPTSMGSIFQVNPATRGSSSDVYTPGQLTSKKWAVPGLKTTTSCGNTTTSETTYSSSTLSANTWYTVTYVFSGSDMVNSTSVSCYFNGSALCEGSTAYVDTSDSSTGCTDVRPGDFRFGSASSSSSYCIDDIIIFTTSTTDAATAAAYTVNTSGGSTGTYFNPYGSTNVNPGAYSGHTFFKVGATSALTSADAKVTGIAAPFTAGGNVYVPVSSLTSVMGSAPAGATETVNGVSCVNVANISTAYSGYYGDYCSMGLISISTESDLIKDGAELSMIPVMQKFLFDNITSSLTNANSFSVDDMKSTDHPYIYADQTRFDELADVWAAGEAGEEVDETLYGYIDNRVVAAQRLYDQYAQKDSSGNYSAMNTTVNLVRGYQNYIYNIPYQTVNATYPGYDVGGRLNESATNNERILLLAYAYQITKDINYAKLAYQFAIYMGQWEHWGPGHFLNVADAASPYAIAYDWLYDAWKQLESEGATYQYSTDGATTFETRTVSVAAIEEIIFTHGIIPAFYSINGADDKLPWRSSASGWNFHTRFNNWNAVCSAGTSLAALALVGNTTATSSIKIDVNVNGVYSADTAINKYPTNNTAVHTNYTTYQDYAEFIVNEALYNLPIYGMEQYVPDGSYIESNGYWSYGTNNYYELVAALTTTTGSDFGLLDCWGMDRTVYFALNTMSSDGNGWNYHDSNSTGAQDTFWFMYLANDEAMGSRDLAGIRKNLNKTLPSKQQPSFYDAIFYLSDEEIGSFTYPELEYYMEGVDGYVVRDSWDSAEGTLYAAFMGNTNNLAHGQIDSGSFVYYNKGTRWFLDLGTEEYNAAGFWGTNTRYRYYAMGAEGNNDLIVTDEPDLLPYGQSVNGFGSLYAHGNNDFGAYAIIDNNSVYAGVTTSAKRGMLFTNDRKTTVIQDEVVLSAAHDIAWIAHTSIGYEIMLSVDGKTAYMSNGTDTIKVTLIDKDNQGLKFSITGCGYDYRLLDGTFENDYSINNGGVAQKSYDAYQRLLIVGEGVSSFNVAVVIEEVIAGETMNDAQGIGYTWTDMDSWTPYEDTRSDGSVGSVDSSVIANVTVTTPVIEETEPGDTPIVDLFDTMWPAAAAVQAVTTGGETTEYQVESFEELETLINSNAGCTIVVDLYESNKTPISITSACTVNTNGNKLLATSASLVANVSGNTVKYETGSVTVTWILAGGAEVKETYTGSIIANYKGTVTEGTTLYEVDNGDGTYSYYTSGNAWSVTENGKQSGANEFIVTSQNNVFYQVGKEFEGLFVTVKGTTVTGYYSANDFFTTNILANTQYDRISITNDFGYDATGKSAISTGKPINLYLNGNTITYTTTENKHMFQVNGGTLNVYGPGSLRSEADQANIFYNDTSIGDDINAYNVDFYSVRAITDLRCNTATFVNCNVTIEQNQSAFTVINRNNAAAVDPYLIIDGCTINMPAFKASSSVFSLRMDAKAEITGGTTIITATDGTLFTLSNSLVSTVDGFDFTTSYQQMYAIIGNVYHNLSTISKSETNDPSGATYDLSGRVFYGSSYTSETAPDSAMVLPGYVVAKTSETLYTVCAEDECAAVWWCDENGIDITSAEYWTAGSTPIANSTVKGYITVPDGKMLVFDTETVEGGKSYYFNAKIIDKFGLQINMSLHSDFNLNFYVQNVGDMTFKIDGEEVTDVDTTSYSGYYKVSKHGINPSVAGKAVTLEVTYGGITISKSISPMDYAARMLEANQSAVTNAMMVNIIKYTEAAYVYTGNNFGENSADYAKVSNLYKKYKSLATVSIVDRQGVDMSAVTDAISGAQLNLADSPKFRFNLKASYTGTVTIGDKTFDVENGVCRGKTYIELTNKAYDLIDDIVITTAKGTATYTLANYYYYEVTEQGKLANLINALYAYCETSAIYQTENNA